MHRKNEPTKETLMLYEALKKRGIKSDLEVYDGHKQVDLSIQWAELDIEIDGLQHFLDSEQIHSDLERSYWSQERDGFDTLHIPNILINKYLDKIADAIAKVARDRYNEIKDDEDDDWF
jgi:very-short-patch-repair endonuclease